MIFEQRMAELGVDLSDLPEHERIPILGIHRVIYEWKGKLLEESDIYRYIMHLVDVIDRMETRLVNVTGERDWLLSIFKDVCACDSCEFREHECPECDSCDPANDPQYVYSGIPEDWRVDG